MPGMSLETSQTLHFPIGEGHKRQNFEKRESAGHKLAIVSQSKASPTRLLQSFRETLEVNTS
jgi:hypothetical protein